MVLGDMQMLDAVMERITGRADEYPALYWGVFRDFPVLNSSRKMLADFAQISQQFFYASNRKIFFLRPDLRYETTAHHLSRILNACYHEPFNDYLNRIRIDAAQKLMRTSD